MFTRHLDMYCMATFPSNTVVVQGNCSTPALPVPVCVLLDVGRGHYAVCVGG